MKKNIDDTFNIKDYFSRNYGLGECPPVFKLHGFWMILYVLIVPIIMYLISRGKKQRWLKSYNERYNNWYKEVDKLYEQKVAEINPRESALRTLGIDESELDPGAEPIRINAKRFIGAYRKAPDGLFRTDVQEITYFLFTEKQIYSYKIIFSLTGDTIETKDDSFTRQEILKEIFYSDIVSIKTSREDTTLNVSKAIGQNEEAPKKKKARAKKNVAVSEEEKNPENEVVVVSSESFTLIVPNDSISCSFYTTPEYTVSIKALRDRIRAKKGQLGRHLEKADDLMARRG